MKRSERQRGTTTKLNIKNRKTRTKMCTILGRPGKIISRTSRKRSRKRRKQTKKKKNKKKKKKKNCKKKKKKNKRRRRRRRVRILMGRKALSMDNKTKIAEGFASAQHKNEQTKNCFHQLAFSCFLLGGCCLNFLFLFIFAWLFWHKPLHHPS